MKYLIPMMVGAVIGYATNWLAIRMLFKPHYEKSLLGFKIPFTPGLIPKEKSRIAKNIGETVGEHLLSPKAISETLLSEKTNKEMEVWIKANINKIKKDKTAIRDLFINLPKNQAEEIKFFIEKLISDSIIQKIQNERTKDIILNLLKEKLYDDKLYEKLNISIKEFLEKALKSNELKGFIEEQIKNQVEKIAKDNRRLKEALPESIELEINKYFDENIENIGNHIRKIMKSPDLQHKMKISIAKMVDQNISRIITSFITPEAISEKIYLAIENYINDKNSNQDILFLIKAFIDSLMESKVSDLAPEIVERIDSEEFANYLLNYLRAKDNQDEIINLINRKIKKIDREKIIKEFSKELDLVLKSNKLENQINLLVKDIINEILNKDLGDIIDKLENRISDISQVTKQVFDQFVINQLPKIIEIFNVSKIVEDEINKFDVEFTEKLILDIASKELKAITWLGALLGALLGLLSPLLQLL